MTRTTQKIISLALVLMLAISVLPTSAFAVTAATESTIATKAASVSTKSTASGLDIQDGVTLHCWNWSYANIEANLEQIVAAGYTAIQTSPIQPLKESSVASWSTYDNHWWLFYQPVDFKINTATNNALGTKTQFESMCAKAEEYGIKVIVDVVANHLGNISGNDKSLAIPSDLRDNSDYWHNISINTSNYSDRYDVTQHCMNGLPDLNTANKDIQNYVLTFLKECVDAGADGFRFDAAKHIETPSDAYGVSSDFWSTVINGIKDYKSDIYVYGEVLDDTGALSISAYTEFMSVTDNQWGDNVRDGVVAGSNAGAYGAYYPKQAAASKLVLWAESHDTYANDNGASKDDSVASINKTWALVAARADAMSLYLARPSSTSQKLGVASTNTGWGWDEVAVVNKFHNDFVGQGEYLASAGSIAYIERGTSGVVLVNCGGTSASVSVPANKMASGTYIDQITGNTFTVSNGYISGAIGSTGIAVVYNACSHTWVASSSTSATCTTNGVIEYTCSGCGDTKAEIIATATGHSYVSGSCSVCGAVEPVDHVLYFNNTNNWSTVNVYYWSDANNAMVTWPGVAMTPLGNGVYTYTVPLEAEYVIFNDGTNQTADLTIPENYNYYSNGSWTTYVVCDHTAHNTSGNCTSCGVAVGHSYLNNVCSCGAVRPEGNIVYLDNNANWTDCKVYFWSDSDTEMTTWPGETMTSEGNGVYSYVLPEDASYVIFNNNSGTQTDDFSLRSVSGNMYDNSNDTWSCNHAWNAATCTIAKTCSVCGTTEGNVAGHSYTSVVTVPTCAEAGYTTYTCSKCSDSYTEAGAAALGHSWTDATCTAPKTCSVCGATEGEALGHPAVTYSYANSTHTFTCTTCNEVAFTKADTESKQFKIASAQPELASNIVMYLGGQLPAGFTNPRIEVEFNGETSYLSDYTINAKGRYEFAFDSINPKTMGDTFTATLYATVEGYEVSAKLEYSMLKYLNSQLKKTSLSAKNRTVMSDLIAYGDANQLYANYKTDTLISTQLAETATLTPSTFTALADSYNVQKVSGVAADEINFKTVSLLLDSKVVISVKVYCPNPEGYTVNVNLAGVDYTYPVSELEAIEGQDGYYYLNFEEVRASQFDEVVTVSFLNPEGAQVSRTLEYSVYTYIQKNQNKDDAKLVALLQAIYNYGESAKKL